MRRGGWRKEERKGGKKGGREEGRRVTMSVLRITEHKQALPGSLQSIWKEEVAKDRPLNSCPSVWKSQLVPTLWPDSPSPLFPHWLAPLGNQSLRMYSWVPSRGGGRSGAMPSGEAWPGKSQQSRCRPSPAALIREIEMLIIF